MPTAEQDLQESQEIRHKEEEATKMILGTGGFAVLGFTRARRAATAKWADGMCKLHARQAGRSEEKYKEEEMMKKQHQQMKLPYYMIPKKSLQFQMAVEGEELDGSIEPPPENPLDVTMDSTFRSRGAGSIVGVLSGRADPNWCCCGPTTVSGGCCAAKSPQTDAAC